MHATVVLIGDSLWGHREQVPVSVTPQRCDGSPPRGNDSTGYLGGVPAAAALHRPRKGHS